MAKDRVQDEADRLGDGPAQEHEHADDGRRCSADRESVSRAHGLRKREPVWARNGALERLTAVEAHLRNTLHNLTVGEWAVMLRARRCARLIPHDHETCFENSFAVFTASAARRNLHFLLNTQIRSTGVGMLSTHLRYDFADDKDRSDGQQDGRHRRQ